ncbi:Methyl-CpG-binding domain protein 4-like protein [Hondaea fermentalgiana]|uniref:Methyl-CpG-binding domain protein 4-like protein n=1 Tax=Hondaea fermentalgiana TaxID=2315210 RepID=A0A2R5GRA5_9STRA|nr:Methyl-CpG-binding domain protein 4-like protein [Hondaea fermentalgiana]|eukprot:GBG33417.1 Methyl-CpG-binding domain protein 4-like protein [Hondaea fermentalgiana]
MASAAEDPVTEAAEASGGMPEVVDSITSGGKAKENMAGEQSQTTGDGIDAGANDTSSNKAKTTSASGSASASAVQGEKEQQEGEQQEEEQQEKPPGMSDYEWKRLQNIRQNEAQLEALFQGSRREARELKEAAAAKAAAEAEAKRAREAWGATANDGEDSSSPKSAKKRRRRGDPIDTSRLRRSSRVPGGSKVKAETNGSQDAGNDDNEEENQEREILDKTPRRPGPEDLQKRLNAIFKARGDEVSMKREDNAWRDEAVQRWGPKVVQADDGEDGEKVDWERYVVSRNVVQGPYPADSPLALLQERYADETWKLLIACCLMSRVSSAKVKERAIEGFFALCPHPSAALDADPEAVRGVLAPLGLFDNRYRSVMELSSKYLLSPSFQLDLAENKVYGFGAFAFDSYLIFTRGLGAEIVPQDKNLRAYCAWAKAEAKKQGEESKLKKES